MMSDSLDQDEIEDCLDVFMEQNFNVVLDANDHLEIAESLIKLRKELT